MARSKKKPICTAKDVVLIAYRYLAYPTDLQVLSMENWMGSLCHLSNEAIQKRKEAYKATGKGLTSAEQQNALPKKRKLDPALRMVYSQVGQDALRRVDKAFQKFFDDIRRKKSGQKVSVGYPRFKRVDRYKSFTFPQVWMAVKDKRLEIVKFRPVAPTTPGGKGKFAYIHLSGIGALKIRLHRSLDWDNAKTVTVKRVPSGAWYVSVSGEVLLEPTLSDNGNVTGVDVGLKKQVAMSDDSYVEYPKFLRQSEAKLKKQQRRLSKKRKGSVNYGAQKIVLARSHEHVANQRADFLHKLSLPLVIVYAYIAFEQLNIPGMVRDPHLATSILDAGWGILIRFVAYKSVMLRGNEIERVNPAYSSQDCSGCGYRVPKTLADRVHRCPQCGLVLCRDTNSARVIEQRAFGKGRAQAERVISTNTVGAESSELVPDQRDKTPVETRASAAPVLRGKSCRCSMEAPTEVLSQSRVVHIQIGIMT